MFVFIRVRDLSRKIFSDLFLIKSNIFKTSDGEADEEEAFQICAQTRVRSDSGKIDILNLVAQKKKNQK